MSNYPFPCLCLSPFHLIPFSFLIFLLSTPSFSCSLLHPSSLAPQSKSHFMLFLNCTQPPSTLAVIPPTISPGGWGDRRSLPNNTDDVSCRLRHGRGQSSLMHRLPRLSNDQRIGIYRERTEKSQFSAPSSLFSLFFLLLLLLFLLLLLLQGCLREELRIVKSFES